MDKELLKELQDALEKVVAVLSKITTTEEGENGDDPKDKPGEPG